MMVNGGVLVGLTMTAGTLTAIFAGNWTTNKLEITLNKRIIHQELLEFVFRIRLLLADCIVHGWLVGRIWTVKVSLRISVLISMETMLLNKWQSTSEIE